MDDEDAVANLSQRVLKRIDKVFDKFAVSKDEISQFGATGLESERPRKRRRVDTVKVKEPATEPGGFVIEESSDAPGGFILDDTEEPAGGFVIEDEGSNSGGGFMLPGQESVTEQDSSVEAHIPLSSIPAALQLLDLPPDDEEVLQVFRHSATGWNSTPGSNGRLENNAISELGVTLRDWRSVCAVLLPSNVNDQGREESEEVEDFPMTTGELSELSELSDEDEDEDAYAELESSPEYEDLEEDEYIPGTRASSSKVKLQSRGSKGDTRRGKSSTPLSKGKGKLRGRRSSNLDDDIIEDDSDLGSDYSERTGPPPITARQRRVAREAFALFFPDIAKTDNNQLDNQRITIKDVARVANFLKEKIKAEEMIDMLTEFSSTSSKEPSMSLADFERMMITTRLA